MDVDEQGYLNDLCKIYNLNPINIIAVTKSDIYNSSLLMKIFGIYPERKGCFIESTSTIYILDDLPDAKFKEVLRHEFRHYWQSIHYPGLFHWWNEHRELYEDINIRQRYDILEIDAQEFSREEEINNTPIENNILENNRYANIAVLEDSIKAN